MNAFAPHSADPTRDALLHAAEATAARRAPGTIPSARLGRIPLGRSPARWARRMLGTTRLLAGVGLLVLATVQTGWAVQAVDVVFVLDNSGSMKTNDPAFLTREAVSDFARAIAQNAELDGRVAVVLFDSKVVLAQPLTPIANADARGELNFALSALDFSGQRTHSPAGIERAIYELRERGREDSRRAIILISDGKIDTGDPQNDLEVARWLQEDLAKESEANGIRIFGVAFTESADYQLMQSLARRTHARYYRAFEATELASVVADVVDRVDKPVHYDLAYLDEPTPLGQAAEDASADAQNSPAPDARAGDGTSFSTRLFAWLPLLLLVVGALAYANHRRSFLGPARRGDADPDLAPPAQLLDFGGLLGDAGSAIPLGQGRTTIGRDPHNTIVINDETVSSEHAVIEADEGRYWIRDRRSTNGTRLGNKRIAAEEKYALKGGDRIRFADVDLMFVVEGYVPGGDTVYMKSTTTPPPISTAVAAEPEIPRALRVNEPAKDTNKDTNSDRRDDSPPAPLHPARAEAHLGGAASDPVKGPSQEIVFAEERERLDPASVIDLDGDLPPGGSAERNSDRRQPAPDRDAVERAERALSAISGGREAARPPVRAGDAHAPVSQDDAMLDAPTAPIKNIRAEPGLAADRRSKSPDAHEINVQTLRDCLDYHLDRVAEISPDFAAFIERGFQDELRTALPVAAKELIEQAHASSTICQRAYTFDHVHYVVCALPGKMSDAERIFGESFGGFTRLLSEHLQSSSFRTDRCKILALLSFGFDGAPWVSLSVVPDEGQLPRIDLLSYEFLSEREHREIEPKSDPEISQSGIG